MSANKSGQIDTHADVLHRDTLKLHLYYCNFVGPTPAVVWYRQNWLERPPSSLQCRRRRLSRDRPGTGCEWVRRAGSSARGSYGQERDADVRFGCVAVRSETERSRVTASQTQLYAAANSSGSQQKLDHRIDRRGSIPRTLSQELRLRLRSRLKRKWSSNRSHSSRAIESAPTFSVLSRADSALSTTWSEYVRLVRVEGCQRFRLMHLDQ